jgi:hypothetical protein
MAQTDNYELFAKNITRIDTDSVSIDIYISRIGTDTVSLAGYDITLSFDYQACANGGTVKIIYVANSADTAGMPSKHKTPTIVYDSLTTPGTFRMYVSNNVYAGSKKIGSASNGMTKLGKIKMRCTAHWMVGSKLNLHWDNAKVSGYLNGSTSVKSLSRKHRQYVQGNTTLN